MLAVGHDGHHLVGQFADDILSSDSEVNLTELPDDELLRLVRLDVTRATV